jgi:lipopolysaccharide export system protein LptC
MTLKQFGTVSCWLALIGLASLSAHTLWQHDASLLSTHPKDPQQADIMINQSVTQHYNAKGQLKTVITAKKTLFYENDHRTLVIDPVIIGYHQTKLHWRIRADRGESLNQGDSIHLNGHVVLYQPKNAEADETTITTENLIYYPKEDRVSSPDFVEIKQPELHFSGIGMTYYLKTSTLITEKASRGHYAQN